MRLESFCAVCYLCEPGALLAVQTTETQRDLPAGYWFLLAGLYAYSIVVCCWQQTNRDYDCVSVSGHEPVVSWRRLCVSLPL